MVNINKFLYSIYRKPMKSLG